MGEREHNIGMDNLIPRVKGDPALPGAGRPVGSKNKLPVLPPIHIDNMPFRVLKHKRGESTVDYWERQSPKTLMYLFRRMDAFIVYSEKGYFDPVGQEIFKLLSRELVKDVRAKSKKRSEAGPVSDVSEGRRVKEFRQELTKMQETLTEDAEIINDGTEDVGLFDNTEGMGLGLGDLEDEF